MTQQSQVRTNCLKGVLLSVSAPTNSKVGYMYLQDQFEVFNLNT